MTASDRPSLSQQAALGAGWLIAGKFLARTLDGVVLIVLARLLSPSDFGLVALAMTLVYIVEAVFELPVGQALLRQPQLSRAHLDTAFSLGLLRGCLVVGLMLGAAYPYAAFVKDPRLAPLLAVLAFAPFFRGLPSPGMVRFTRAMDFRPDFMFEIVSKVAASLVALSVAWSTRSYWALAAGTVVAPATTVVLSYLVAPHRPRLTFREWPIFSHIVGWNLVSQVVASTNWQLDRVLLGRFVPSSDLGRFAISSDIAGLPHQALLVPTLRPMAAAMFASGGDPDRVRAMYLKSSNAIVLIGAPVFTGLAVLADPAVRLLLGPQWHGAAPLLAGLALAVLPFLPTLTLSPALFALKQGQWFSVLCLIELCVRAPVTVVAVVQFGVEGATSARLGVGLLTMLIGMMLASRVLRVTIWRQLCAIARPASAALAMGLPLVFAREALEKLPAGPALWLATASVAGVGACLYGVTLIALWLASGSPDGVEATVVGRTRRVLRRLGRR